MFTITAQPRQTEVTDRESGLKRTMEVTEIFHFCNLNEKGQPLKEWQPPLYFEDGQDQDGNPYYKMITSNGEVKGARLLKQNGVVIGYKEVIWK